MPSMPRLRGVEISPGTWPGSPARSPTPLRTSGCRSSPPCRVDVPIRMDSPGVTDILGTIIYAVILILLAAAQAIGIVVIAYGFIATAVCVLVGPVFVPFFIVPRMDWIFWGWLRCFIQYAFYQVIAAAVVYVIANLILGIMDLQPKGTISTGELMEAFPVLFITFLASIYALLKIPALTHHVFSGASGGSSAVLLNPKPGSLLP